MNRYVRVIAQFAGSSQEPPDTDYKIVFDTLVNEDNKIVKNNYFGYSLEQKEKWPFILEAQANDRKSCLYFGAGSEELREIINIFDKNISVGQLFTRSFPDNDEWTYRILNVVDLLSPQ